MVKEKIAQIWPEWEIEHQLGKGSYGEVYQAIRRDGINDRAAIKVISIPSDSSELDSLRSEGASINDAKTFFRGIVNDFMNEIRLMNSLKGMQNIVSVEDYKVIERTEEIGWDIYIRMELLTPFNTYIREKQLTEKDVIQLGIHICTALEICSQRNIIHRDIKPENIFINNFGYYKLGDFGIARNLENTTGGMSQKGTLNYMAPEVANSSEYDARVDIYSLGIVLYRLLNQNRLPFIESEQQQFNPNERKLAMERRIRGEQFAPPCSASDFTAAIILKACAFNPNERFVNATEMKNALSRALLQARDSVAPTVSVQKSEPTAEPDFTKTERVRRTDNSSTLNPVQPMNNTISRIPTQPVQPVNNTVNRIPTQPVQPMNNTINRIPTQPVQPMNNTVNRGPAQPVQPISNGVNRPVTPQPVGKKTNILCLLAFITCFIPLMFALIAEAAGEESIKSVNLFFAFLPPILGFLGIKNAKRTNTKGKALGIVSLIIGVIYVIGAIVTMAL